MENSKKKKNILVTGGAGFIGSNLIEQLVKEGHDVTSLDNYFTGKKENHIAGATYIEGHTKDIATLVDFVPDLIFHLGEYARVAKSLEEPDVVLNLNMIGTIGVIEFWRKSKCKLIYAGSSTKHADIRDDGVQGRNLSPYTWSKAANSDLIASYGRWYDLPYAITYFYNVYGPRERGDGERGTFIEMCKQRSVKNEKHKIAAPGTQTRAFTHVADTVSGLMFVGEYGNAEEYGISAKEVYSLCDVAEMWGGDVEIVPQTKSTRSSGNIDTTKLEKLGWQQKHTLEDYIRQFK